MFQTITDLFKYDKRFRFGSLGLLLIIIFIFLSFFSPYKEGSTYNVPKNRLPSLKYPLGTNSRGQDLFWNMTVALRNSFYLGILTCLISRAIAIVVGLTAGYKGGLYDRVVMSINDSLVVIPGLPLILLLGFSLGGTLKIITLAVMLGVTKGWPWDARLIRSQILSLKERPFTNTSTFSGMRDWAIMVKEHLPYTLPIVFATAINNIIWAIGLEVTLAIFGLRDIQSPSIGVAIYWANQHSAMIAGIWWWYTVPIVVAFILFVSLYLLSVSLDDYLDPRTRMQRMGKVV